MSNLLNQVSGVAKEAKQWFATRALAPQPANTFAETDRYTDLRVKSLEAMLRDPSSSEIQRNALLVYVYALQEGHRSLTREFVTDRYTAQCDISKEVITELLGSLQGQEVAATDFMRTAPLRFYLNQARTALQTNKPFVSEDWILFHQVANELLVRLGFSEGDTSDLRSLVTAILETRNGHPALKIAKKTSVLRGYRGVPSAWWSD